MNSAGFLKVFLLLGVLASIEAAWRTMSSGGTWSDRGSTWTGSTPGSDAIFHFGPTRLWTTPINSGHYEIKSRVYSSGFDCGHVFKYKSGSTRTRSRVTKAWGYYLSYGNQLRITSSGTEYSPKISYSYPLNTWNTLKTIVNGTTVRIYINNRLAQQVTMRGSGATSTTANYVGIWCHSSTSDRGDSFRVRDLAVCPRFSVGRGVITSSRQCVTSSSRIGTRCNFRCSRGFRLVGPAYKRCVPGGRWSSSSRVTCSDMNECARNQGDCSHHCINTPGSFRCSCPDTELRLGQDGRTCEAPGARVTCGANHMRIDIPKSALPGVLLQDLRLNSTSCHANQTRTHFRLATALNACGTVAKQTRSKIVYTNTVLERPLARNATITRVRDLEIRFSCAYPRTGHVVSNNLKPRLRKLTFSVVGSGQYTLSMNIFPNASYQTSYSRFPVSVPLWKRLYLEIGVKSVDKQLSIIAENCYATPNSTGEAPKHYFIKRSCAVDSTVSFIRAPAKSSQRFTLQAFRFLGNHRYVYFHCNVIVCDARDRQSACAIGCRKGRGKREIDEQGNNAVFRLSQGPVTTGKEEEDIEAVSRRSQGPVTTGNEEEDDTEAVSRRSQGPVTTGNEEEEDTEAVSRRSQGYVTTDNEEEEDIEGGGDGEIPDEAIKLATDGEIVGA